MIAKIFNFILSFDQKAGNTVILSTDPTTIILPVFSIDNPKLIIEEIKYNTKNLFNDPGLKYIELIDISFMEIQNQYLIDYLKEQNSKYDYNENNDLCILSGLLLAEKYISNLHWVNVPKQLSIDTEKNVPKFDQLTLLIDHVIKNMVL